MVTFLFHGENTLDLFLTSNPTLVTGVEGLPPLSDQDMVYMEYDLNTINKIKKLTGTP